MKTTVVILAVVMIAGAGAMLLPAGCSRAGSGHAASQSIKYHCPMHPTVVQDKKGSCPICGMDLVPVEKEGDVAGESPSSVPGLATVEIPDEARQRMGLRLGVVEKRLLTGAVRSSARIEADETRLFTVTAKIEGWVDKLFVATTGQAVTQGDPLLTVYSPELVSAQAEYLAVLATRRTPAGGQGDGDSLLAAARRRLEYWDISDEQIVRLEKTGKAEKTLTLYAPASGWVTERRISAGQKIMPGEALMVVSDLTVIWADADIYPSDLPYIKVGMPVEVALPYWPGQVFTGRVSFIAPTLDPVTRTLAARLEIPNPDLQLKPGMYATATLQYAHGEKLAVPAAAVIFTGTRVVAFRDAGGGRLAPAELKLGVRSGDYYEVLAGLDEGDPVVISANFLVDSESSMKAALEPLKNGGGTQPGHAGP
jgi:Cu(I)/Ag(I) efflux system membrane fusion protein